MQRKIRVLVGKPGLDGHDRGAKVVAASLRDAGMEVIYTGLHQSPEQIVEAAAQEDVDVVALSILSGAHMTLFPEVMKLMRARGIGDRLLTGGGIIPADDMAALTKKGVGRLFGPGSSTQDIAEYIRGWFQEAHPDEALTGAARASREAAAPKPAPAAKHAAVARKGAAAKPAAVAKTVAAAKAPATKRPARAAARTAAKPAPAAKPKRSAPHKLAGRRGR